jgi:AcrR family transcriptional regulator
MPTPRKPRKALNDKVVAFKRDAILDAAQTVFAERGYHRTTIKDIAAQAGVADGTVYNYFEGKDALLSALFDRLQAGVTAGPAGGGDIGAGFEPDTLALVRVLLSEMLVDAALRERYRDRFLAPVAQLIDPTLNTQDPLAARATAATVLGMMLLHLLGEPAVVQHWERLPAFLLALGDRK